jgi:hypothetical protein
MAKRYGPEPVANRALLDSAYARALAPLAKKYPNDPDVQTLYAESLLDLSPWNYWTDRGTKPRPDTRAMVASLEKTIAKYPNHPGACHFYIHAVEASTTPERALPCANRLAELMPGAGHLVHMPSHIYMRTGQYDLVVEHKTITRWRRTRPTSRTGVRPASTSTATTPTTTTCCGRG